MMYREVKVSERLPENKNWDGVVKTMPDDLGIQFFQGTYHELIGSDYTWLEPIEITEEEIGKMIESLSTTIKFNPGKANSNNTLVLLADHFKKASILILSKLKGE